MRHTRRALLLPLCLQLASTASGQVFQLPAHFEVVALSPILDQPVGAAFAANGTLFVLEKRGTVKVVLPDQQLQGSPFLDLADEVNNDHDRGMLGLALHPGFVADGGSHSWVYLLYTVSPVAGQDLGFNQDSKYSFSRLTKYRAITTPAGIVADLSSRHVMLGNMLADGSVPDCIASVHDSHSNGSLRFADDGTLLLTTGDGAHYDFQDNGGADAAGFDTFTHPQTGKKGPTPKLQDEGAFRSQDLRSLAGKVLRLDPATGEGVPSNPFYDGNPQSNRSRVFALGLRNPFRMTLFPGTGSGDPAVGDPNTIVLGDVGWNTWEELNVSRSGGENFGWPCFEGTPTQPGYFAHSSTDPNKVTCKTPVSGTLTGPALAWNHGNAAALEPPGVYLDKNGNPAPGFAGNCAIGGEFYRGGGSYPASYDGKLFFANLNSAIYIATFDTNQSLVAVQAFATGTGTIVDFARNPQNGDLYLCSLTANRILHLRYTNNLTPIAKATASPAYGPGPLTVTFDATGSYDPDGDPLDYDWDFGDGSPHGNGSIVQHIYGTDAVYTAVLRASDLAGNTGLAEVEVGVGNAPPEAIILAPAMGTTYQTPASLALKGSGIDPEQAPLTYQWQVDLYHATHIHPASFVATGAEVTLPITTSPEDKDLLYYRIELTVTDPAGLQGRAHVFVYPADHLADVSGTPLPIARVFELAPPGPLGASNKDIEVVRDGQYPVVGSSSPALNFDTYHLGAQGNDDWIGYDLGAQPAPEFRFVGLRFQEGIGNIFGGYFEDLRVEARQAGAWQVAGNLHVTPDYPYANDGVSFSTYELRFDPIEGDAIRLRGKPGGSLKYISVGELRALAISGEGNDHYRDITTAGAIVGAVFQLHPPGPTGTTGNPDPETLRNGTFPPVGSTSVLAAFDTSHNGEQGAFDWLGHAFTGERTFARVVYQEGRDLPTGGTFSNVGVEVQLLANGPWTSVTGLSVSPPYPGMNLVHYQTFTFDFAPVVARAIRIAGTPAGSGKFISAGELRVYEPKPQDGAGWYPYGEGLGGANSMALTSPTPFALGLPVKISALAGYPAANGVLLLSAAAAGLPFGGGTLLVDPNQLIVVPITFDANGTFTASAEVPAAPTLSGTAVFLQAISDNPAAPGQVRLSHGLKGVFGTW